MLFPALLRAMEPLLAKGCPPRPQPQTREALGRRKRQLNLEAAADAADARGGGPEGANEGDEGDEGEGALGLFDEEEAE